MAINEKTLKGKALVCGCGSRCTWLLLNLDEGCSPTLASCGLACRGGLFVEEGPAFREVQFKGLKRVDASSASRLVKNSR